MNLFAKALIMAKKVYEPLVDHLYLAKVKIKKPEDYESPASDYSEITAEATATGSKYIYVYIVEKFWQLFDEVDDGIKTIVVQTDDSRLLVQQYNASARRFAIGTLANTPTGTYNIYVYNAKTKENIYEIKLNWKNDYI